MSATAKTRMPVVFIGHGRPMNTRASNQYTETWRRLGAEASRPKAKRCVLPWTDTRLNLREC